MILFTLFEANRNHVPISHHVVAAWCFVVRMAIFKLRHNFQTNDKQHVLESARRTFDSSTLVRQKIVGAGDISLDESLRAWSE
jgi:MFS-type transporter involved in bile tolerance (Atg22 family)